MQTDFDAIVVGAGPAGSTAAILLAQAGWSVALVEKLPFPRRKVCGECVAATNLELLDALGVGDAFARLAGPKLRQVAVMLGDTTICADLPPLADAAHPWGRALGREHLDTLLLQRARAVGATILQPWAVRSIQRAGGLFHCAVHASESPAKETLTARTLIEANGSWEPAPSTDTRHRLPARDADLFAFKATFRDACLPGGVLPILAFPGGYGGMVVGDHGLTTVACCIRRDRLRECRRALPGENAGAAVEAHLRASCSGVRAALSGAAREGAWLAVGPIRPGIRLAQRSMGFRIGNAAGETHPIIGEGISMAIQSAWLLCERLIAHRDDLSAGVGAEAIRVDYEAAWRRSFASRLRWARWCASIASRPGLARLGLPLLQRWPSLLTTGARLSGKVTRMVRPPDVSSVNTGALGAQANP